MKLLMPELDFSTAFSRENDIFERKRLAQKLEKIISKSEDDSLVIGLDDNWGNGKTTFLKMWHQKLTDEGTFKVIYYDSFKNDFQSDPFISISSEIYKLIDEDDVSLKERFLEITKRVGSAFFKTGMKIGVTLATAGIVRGSEAEEFKDEIVSGINEPIEKFIEQKLLHKEKEDQTLIHFKETLEEIGKDKKLIFIIDELDRARPNFCLELLEKIKHIFQAKNIIFLLSVNKDQFQHTIQKTYGMIDSQTYLNKFVHFWFKLPREINERDIAIEEKFLQTLHLKLSQTNSDYQTSLKTISTLIRTTNSSLREAERSYSLVLLMNAASESSYLWQYQIGIGLVAFLKVKNEKLLDDILFERVTYDEICNALNIPRSLPKTSKERNKFLIALAIYDQVLTPEQYTEQLTENKELLLPSDYNDQWKLITNVYNEFKEFI